MSGLDSTLCWPLERLGEALHALAQHAGLRPLDGAPLAVPQAVCDTQPGELGRWLPWAGQRLGVDVEPVTCAVPQAQALLERAAPALLAFHDGQAPRCVALLGRRGRWLRVLAPDGRVARCDAAALRDALCARHERPLAPELDRVLDAAAIAPRQRAAARRALLAERLQGASLHGCWLLRQPPGAPAWQQLVLAGLPRRLAAMLALTALAYTLEISGWRLVGAAALDGRLDLGWLAAWALLLLSMVPLRSLGAWLGATFAQEASRLLKRRLLAGALRFDLDPLRQQGAGQLLARVIESQALEAHGLGGAIGVVVALLELGFAAWVLSLGAAPLWHALLLAGWLLLLGALALRFHRRLRAWTEGRLALTQRLVEDMVGHRTRLAQEQPRRRDAEQDRALHRYAQQAAALDAATVPIAAAAPGGWILLGLAGLAPALLAGATPAALAISVGGVLFAHRALGAVSGSLSTLARAHIAWQQAAPLFHAGAGPEESAAHRPVAEPAADAADAADAAAAGPLVDASQLAFRYRADAEPVLQGVDLRIGAADRILLQGASGGGKSTLAALLVGLRRPASGLLLLQGLDRRTLGASWHRRATEAPQFHDNHVFAGTLAFNLLLGHEGAADAATLAEARTLCEELGLGELLARMPAGLQQRVGETGWQLSHGEKGRLFLARALLQRAPLTVLDESFAALDPATLRLCLQTALRRTQALVVIAHP